jgi:hypothetical protein
MGVLRVTIFRNSPRSTWTAETRDRTYRETFTVQMDNSHDPRNQVPVMNAQDPNSGLKVPSLWSLHPFDLQAVCHQKECEQIGPAEYRVHCGYNNKVKPETEGGDNDPNPLARPAKWTVDVEGQEYPLEFDARDEDKKVVNTAGDKFADPIVELDYVTALVITKNTASFSQGDVQAYANKCNSDSVGGWPPNTLLIKKLSGEELYENGVAYWARRYEILANPKGWTRRPRNQGTREKIDGKLVRITGADGYPITTPVDLDNDGKRLAEGADPIYLEFESKGTTSFFSLGLW